MKSGDIYLHKEFQFEEGETGKKLFVVVGFNKKVILVCKTTSRERPPYRLKRRGCSAPEKNYYMFLSKKDSFEKNTWVQFDMIYKFHPKKVLSDLYGGKAVKIGQLEGQNTRALLNCILKSEDVPGYQLDTVKKSLKELN